MSTTIKLGFVFFFGTALVYLGLSLGHKEALVFSSFKDRNLASVQENISAKKKSLRMPSKMTSFFSPVVSAEQLDSSTFRLRVEELDILSNPEQPIHLQWHLKDHVELIQGSLSDEALPEQLLGSEILVRVLKTDSSAEAEIQQVALEVYRQVGSDKIGSTTQPIFQAKSQSPSDSNSSQTGVSMKALGAGPSENADEKPAVGKIHY
jgi:hypothetical protein